MDHRLVVVAVLAAGLGTSVTACGSARQPDTGGVDLEDYLARFRGEWVLEGEITDDLEAVFGPPEQVAEALTSGDDGDDGRPPSGGAAPPGAGGGVPGAGGGAPERPAVSLDRAAVAATVEAAGALAERMTLDVGDSLRLSSWPPGGELRIALAGGGVSAGRVDGFGVDARAEWNGGRLELRRELDDGGTVVDVFEVFPDLERLVVRRSLEGLPFPGDRSPEARIAYRRAARGAP